MTIIDEFLSKADSTRLLYSLTAHNEYQRRLVQKIAAAWYDHEREEYSSALTLSLEFTDRVIQELYKRESP